MGQVRKIKAGLVKIPIDQFVGEDGHIFFDTDDGTLRLSDGVTPGGSILSSAGGGGTSNYNNLTNKPDLTVYQLSADAFSGDYDDLTDAPIAVTVTDLTISKNLLPNANETLDIGSTSLRFRDIYLSGETIDLGGTKLNKNTDGDLEVKDTNGAFKKVKAKEIELDDGTKDATNKVVMRLGSDGTPEFKRVNKTTGVDVETHTKFDLLTIAKTITLSTAPTEDAHVTNKAYVDGLIPTVFSGDYNDLTNKPTIPTAFSGDYDDLTNKPTIPTAFSGDYTDLTNKPTLFDGVYDSLTSKPTLFDGVYDSLTSKPTLFSGDYDDLTSKPTLLQIGTTATTALAGNASIGDLSNVDGLVSAGQGTILAYDTAEGNYRPENVNNLVDDVEEQYLTVLAGTGLTKGDLCYVTGVSSGVPVVQLADANQLSTHAVGIATETVTNGDTTKLLTKGILSNIDTTTTAMPGSGNLLYMSEAAGNLTRTAPVAFQIMTQQVATILTTSATTGSILVDINAPIVGIAELAHNEIAIGGPNGEQKANWYDVALPALTLMHTGVKSVVNAIEASSAGSPIGSNRAQDSNASVDTIVIGTAAGINNFALFYDDPTSPANDQVVIRSDQGIMTLDAPEVRVNVGKNGEVGGFRIFNFATSEVEGQEQVFHTTQNGIHVGNDRRGTYTAGDNQINQDTDYGILAGRDSFNYGSNNFGFGEDIDFSSNTVANLGVGALIDVKSYISNSVAFGGSVIAGDGVSAKTSIFAGGHITKTTGNYGFTWGNGVYPGGATVYYSENHADGGVLFGKQSILTENATNSFIAGGIGAASENFEAHKIDSAHSFNYGKSNHIKADSDNSGTIGLYHILDTAPQGFAAGEIQRLTNTRASAAVGALNELGSAEHTTGNDYLFAAGYKNEPLGNGGMCLGYQLKTPLNRATSDDPYQWEDGCTVVGAHNDPLKKFDTDDGVGATWVQNQRFVVGTGVSAAAPTTGFVVAKPVIDSGNTTFSGIIMTHLAESDSYPNPAAARTAGVPTGGLYRTGNDVKILLAGD